MKYRKKPVIIEAFQWTGDAFQNEDPDWINNAICEGIVGFESCGTENVKMSIETLEGTIIANRG